MAQVYSEIFSFVTYLEFNKFNGDFIEIWTSKGGNFNLLSSFVDKDKIKISIDLPNGIHGGINVFDGIERDDRIKDKFENVYLIRDD